MKKHFFAVLLAISALGVSGCKKDPKLPTPAVEEFPQIYTNIGAQSTYKVSEISGGNPVAKFDIDVRGGDVSKVEAIEIYRQFRGFNVPAMTTPPTAPALGVGQARVLLRSVPPTSGTIEVSVDDMINGLTRPTGSSQAGNRTAVTRASLRANESFIITYALMLKGGRRIEYNASFNNAPFSGSVTVVP